jgi:hypothetical protein
MPAHAGDPDAGEEEHDEQRRQQPADPAGLMLAGPSNQKHPGVVERVGAHAASPLLQRFDPILLWPQKTIAATVHAEIPENCANSMRQIIPAFSAFSAMKLRRLAFRPVRPGQGPVSS